jgi:Phytanoyl-CoA dioxygenase (PhyH)
MSVRINVPELAADYGVSPEHVSQFQRDGHILLRRVATPEEVAAYRTIILNARETHGAERTPLEQRDTYGKAFLKGMNLWTKDEGVRRFVLARRFGKIAAELLGVQGVRVYHDQALIKEPRGGITPWHQDQHYWPLDTSNTVTMWMPLTDVTPEMGTLRFATASHSEGYLGDLPIGNESEARLEALIRVRAFTTVGPCTALPEIQQRTTER